VLRYVLAFSLVSGLLLVEWSMVEIPLIQRAGVRLNSLLNDRRRLFGSRTCFKQDLTLAAKRQMAKFKRNTVHKHSARAHIHIVYSTPASTNTS
jgi:hypothetical protein